MPTPRDERLEALAKRIRQVDGVPEIGPALIEAKSLLGHGRWLSWLHENFNWTPKTAQRIVRAYTTLGPNATIAPPVVAFAKRRARTKAVAVSRPRPRPILWAAGARDRVDKSAYYLLSQAKVPDAVRRAVVERANEGRHISHADVLEALDCPSRKLAPTPEEERAHSLKVTGDLLAGDLDGLAWTFQFFSHDRKADRKINFASLAQQIAASDGGTAFCRKLKRARKNLDLLDRMLSP